MCGRNNRTHRPGSCTVTRVCDGLFGTLNPDGVPNTLWSGGRPSMPHTFDLVRYWGVPDTPPTRPNQPPTSTDPATTRPASRPESTPSTPPTPHHDPPLTSANVLNVRSHLNVGRPPPTTASPLSRRRIPSSSPPRRSPRRSTPHASCWVQLGWTSTRRSENCSPSSVCPSPTKRPPWTSQA